ncbi:MAG: ABC transporter permease [Ignavibacteria bacterium]|nr:ABC transporter permease [Ignavibacteria bacterium]
MFLRRFLRRIFASAVMLIALITIVFFLVRLVPGDPTHQYYSPKLGSELADRVKVQFGLDQPVHVQFLKWFGNLAAGDLGYSISFRKPVIDVILTALPVTLTLAVLALIFQMFLGILFGTLAGANPNSKLDNTINIGSLVIYCAPSFLIGLFLIYFGSVKLGLFPTSHLHSTEYEDFSAVNQFLDFLHHIFLPVLTLTITSAAFTTRFVRESLSNVLSQPFITALRSTGMGERKLVLSHALPNSLLPLITLLGIEIGSLLSGALITETIFSLPGLGRLTVDAIFSRDYPLVIGCTLISGFLVITGNFIADMLHAKLDARVSFETIG